MPVPRADADRVGTALAWGVVFSLLFHVILFSPQLAALLDPEQRHEVLAEAKQKAREDAKAKDGAREDRPPEAKAPPPGERPPEPPEAPKAPEQERSPGDEAAQRPPQPMAELRPIETPEPAPAYPDVEDVAIGQDDGDAMSVVIIGRDDFEEHMAQLSVVSQAGFRMSDAGGDGRRDYGRGDDGSGGGGGGAAPNAAANTVAAKDAGSAASKAPTTVAALPAPERPDGLQPLTPTPVVPEPPVPAPPVPPLPIQPTQPAEPVPSPVDAPPDPNAPPPEAPRPAVELTPPPKPPEPVVPPSPAPSEPRPPLPEPLDGQKPPPGGGIASKERPAGSATDRAPGEAGKAGGSGPSPVPGTGGEGELSDLESPATSITAVDPKLWRNGRLVAAQGVQLKPRQPQFTSLQMVSLLPGCRPPVVSLTFDRTGRCVDVFFNRSSGDSEIDGVIRNSLFFWRAAGKKIDELKDDAKVRVTLQLIL